MLKDGKRKEMIHGFRLDEIYIVKKSVEDTGRRERVSESSQDTERRELENTAGEGWMILGEKSRGYREKVG